MTRIFRILRTYRNHSRDDRQGTTFPKAIFEALKIDVGEVKSAKLFSVATDLNTQDINHYATEVICDQLLHCCEVFWGDINDSKMSKLSNPKSSTEPKNFAHCIVVGFLPGMTDDEGANAQRILVSLQPELNLSEQRVFSHTVVWIKNELSYEKLQRIATNFLGNPLVNYFEFVPSITQSVYIPVATTSAKTVIETYDLSVDNAALVSLSKSKVWALDEAEMIAIRNHFADTKVIAERQANGLPTHPTDCEMEILAQTWSEHCKHKEFAANISFKNFDNNSTTNISSLYKTYIQAPTLTIGENLKSHGHDWLVKVFSDNAGCVKVDSDRLFVWKVETHNSPSALDPYGGALTGIVGVNRDPLGTGRGGAKLLFNTNVLCFGFPNDSKPLLKGQLHPKRVLKGVVKGIEDGGNKSGIPTINGSVVFHDDYRGKPLVYCGTAAILPTIVAGTNSWEKHIQPGDRILMAGGRVGRDGIHGATFSSTELGEGAPRSAVQIGSPFTQKMMADFLEVACSRGLISCITDNGAGGLSSSIGELATFSNGATVELDKVPLKYHGLQPWEIFVSESQERMTLVANSQKVADLLKLANKYEVEVTDIGEFTDSGSLKLAWHSETVAMLSLNFLHEGTPRKSLEAEWKTPISTEQFATPDECECKSLWLRMMAQPNIASKEWIIHQYDHEVKGRTILKPLMGRHANSPQDAGVMRLDFSGFTGVAVSNGLAPRFANRDPYASAANAFDEAVRQIISVGGSLPDPTKKDCGFWSVNDNFCVPDSIYDPTENPDGKIKLGRLVLMCQALKDMSLAYGVPMTSGKDSMKNDFRVDGIKISAPLTLLFSAAAKINDVRKVVSSDFKTGGDKIYLVGETRVEFAGTELADILKLDSGAIPQVHAADAIDTYTKMALATSQNLLASSHDLSDGGLAVALAESAFGGSKGAKVLLDTTKAQLAAWLFSETPSRFVVSVNKENCDKFENIFGAKATFLGTVEDSKLISIRASVSGYKLDIETSALETEWHNGLRLQ